MAASKQERKPMLLLEDLLDIDGLMCVLKVKSRQTVYKLIKSGLPAVYIGGQLRFVPSDVAQWVHEQRA
jgi:excisionase family DNA binding protein